MLSTLRTRPRDLLHPTGEEQAAFEELADRCGIGLDDAVRRTALFLCATRRHSTIADPRARQRSEHALVALFALPGGRSASVAQRIDAVRQRLGRHDHPVMGAIRIDLRSADHELIETVATIRGVTRERLLSQTARAITAELADLQAGERVVA
jgi:hypothetical protein